MTNNTLQKQLTRKGKKGKKTYTKKPNMSKLIKNEIAAIAMKKMERKSQASSVLNVPLLIYNPATFQLSTFDITSVLGAVTQGVGQGSRIGNKINVSKCTVRGYISVIASAITSNLHFRLILVSLKQSLTTPNGFYNGLYQLGNSVISPTGTQLDMMRNFNHDQFTIHAQRKVLMGSSDAVTSILAMNNTIGNYAFRFDLTKVLGGTVIYNDTTVLPSNKSCYLSFIPCNADGTVVTALEVAPFNVTIDTELFYTDD